MKIISRNVKRKKVNFKCEMNEDTKDTLIHNPYIYMLYELNNFNI